MRSWCSVVSSESNPQYISARFHIRCAIVQFHMRCSSVSVVRHIEQSGIPVLVWRGYAWCFHKKVCNLVAEFSSVAFQIDFHCSCSSSVARRGSRCWSLACRCFSSHSPWLIVLVWALHFFHSCCVLLKCILFGEYL